MKKKIALSILIAIAIAGVANAQKSKVSDPKPYYEIRKGGTITFRLLEHTGGGYMWQWKNQTQVNVVDTVSVRIQSTSTDSRKIGAPTYSIWTFKGIKRGVETLRFEELRVFQKNSTINTKEIVVRVR
jgi:predicted secreted protein